MEEMELLQRLQSALAKLNTTSNLEPASIPVLWVPIPQTHGVQEMVLLNKGDVLGRHYVWDGNYYPVNDPDALADDLTSHIRTYTASWPAER